MPAITPITRRREPNDPAYARAAIGVYVAALIVPYGAMGFSIGFGALWDCVKDPARQEIGPWLLALSWLANPAVWAAIILLRGGLRWSAAVAGVIALMFAMCAAGVGVISPGYYLWIVCMLLVTFPALRAPSSVKRSDDAIDVGPANGKHSRRRRLLWLSLAVVPLFGIILVVLRIQGSYAVFWWDDPDAIVDVYTGEAARQSILEHPGAARHHDLKPNGLPSSAKDFWFCRSGFLGKSREYLTFTCGSRDDCLKAVEFLGGILPADLKPWKPSKYAVVMEGPVRDSKKRPTRSKRRGNPWDVRGIKHGVAYEDTSVDHGNSRADWMHFYAIDFDANRVFYHHESGGFSTNEYDPGDDAKATNLSGG